MGGETWEEGGGRREGGGGREGGREAGRQAGLDNGCQQQRQRSLRVKRQQAVLYHDPSLLPWWEFPGPGPEGRTQAKPEDSTS
jgi:hypothetical protein